MNEEQKEKLREIVGLFDRAEQRVKEVERLDGSLSIPSINQLRYVGYHLARALCEEADEVSFTSELSKAENHCRRAIYDAHEVGVIHLLESIKAFKLRHASNSSSVIEVVPTYAEDLAAATKAANFIDEVKANHPDDRDAYYAEAEPHYSRLLGIEQTLSAGEPLIVTSAENKLKEDKRQTRRFIATVLLSLLGLSVGGTMIVLKVFGT